MKSVQLQSAFGNVIQEFHRIHRKTPIFTFITGSLALGVSVYGLKVILRALKLLLTPENDLPMGLPNPKNMCYLNAVLQAMSSNSTLVRFLRRSAKLHPNKMLYCLVCILKGLRCSNRYIISNNLDGVLRDTHRLLLIELANSKHWTPDDQQDAPELFSYFMDVACSRPLGCTATRATEGLSSVSEFVESRFEHAVPRCFHRSRINGKTQAYAFRSPLRTDVFQRHLLANQVICTNCGYRSSPNLQAESCITLCFDPSLSIPKSAKNSSKLRQAPDSRCSAVSPSLYDYLSKEFGTKEKLNDFLCPGCQQTEHRSSATVTDYCHQERWIAHLPSCLVIHVQRGEWMGDYIPAEVKSPWPGVARKRSDYLSFPCRLNMTDFMLSAKNNRRSRQNSFDDHNTEVDSTESCFRRHHSYILRSVLVHQGESVHAGHYVTYRTWRRVDPTAQRKRYSLFRMIRSMLTSMSNYFRALPRVVSSPWVFTSDEQVFRVPQEEVRSCLAYLLFYEREPPHFRSFRTGSVSRRTSVYDDGSLSESLRSNCPTFHRRAPATSWDHSDVNGSAWSGIVKPGTTGITVGGKNYDETDTEGEEEEEDEGESEESDVPSDYAEEEFTGSRAEVIRAMAMAAARM